MGWSRISSIGMSVGNLLLVKCSQVNKEIFIILFLKYFFSVTPENLLLSGKS